MKNVVKVSLAIIILALSIICISKIEIKDKFVVSSIDGISISIKENSLNNEGAIVVITDTTNEDNLYGFWFKIQVLNNKEWEDLKEKNNDIVFSSNGLKINENNELEIKQNWKELYGELKSGKYRLIKKVIQIKTNKILYLGVEFNVN